MLPPLRSAPTFQCSAVQDTADSNGVDDFCRASGFFLLLKAGSLHAQESFGSVQGMEFEGTGCTLAMAVLVYIYELRFQ